MDKSRGTINSGTPYSLLGAQWTISVDTLAYTYSVRGMAEDMVKQKWIRVSDGWSNQPPTNLT